MARLQSSRSLMMPLIYNIDQPVGYGLANRSEDVLLVQYLLKIAYDGRKQLGLASWASYEAERPLVPDGHFGPITGDHILRYQAALAAAGGLPGRQEVGAAVHPARGFAIQSTGNLGIIVMLNVHFQRLRSNDYLHLGAARDLPPRLAGSQLCIG